MDTLLFKRKKFLEKEEENASKESVQIFMLNYGQKKEVS